MIIRRAIRIKFIVMWVFDAVIMGFVYVGMLSIVLQSNQIWTRIPFFPWQELMWL